MDPSEVTRTSATIEVGEVDFTDNQEVESRGSAYEVVTMPSRFAQPQGKGFIDVYWLYDDGGGCRASCTGGTRLTVLGVHSSSLNTVGFTKTVGGVFTPHPLPCCRPLPTAATPPDPGQQMEGLQTANLHCQLSAANRQRSPQVETVLLLP